MRPTTKRTLYALAAAGLLAFASGGLAVTFAAEQAVEEGAGTAPNPKGPAGPGGFCNCREARAEDDSGAYCGGRAARSGGPGMRGRHGRGTGMRHGRGGSPGGHRFGGRAVMATTRDLVHRFRHDIVRRVEQLDNGVRTVTRAPGHPEAAAAVKRHVGEMRELLEGGGRIRSWDPLFSEIFDHYDEVEMVVEELEDGVRVTETSENPEVVKLIRAHARKVDDFVARGPAAVHEPTSLPDDYRDSE